MAKTEERRTVIRLNRFFLLGNGEYRKTFLFIVTVFGLIPMILLISTHALAWWNVLLLFLLNSICCVIVSLEYPGKLYFEAGTINFTERYSSTRGSAVRANVTLTDLREIRFAQNRVERLFGVARLCLTATPQAEYTGTFREDIPKYPRTHFVFCGVRADKTPELLRAELPEKAFAK